MGDVEGYSSIGEVLAFLQIDYPEVSISKIRFLESQGLIDPERTPSGYRKFYEGDINRLRRILQLQRETFMPLKVIKGTIEAEFAVEASATSGDVVSIGDHVEEQLPPREGVERTGETPGAKAPEHRSGRSRTPSIFRAGGDGPHHEDAVGSPATTGESAVGVTVVSSRAEQASELQRISDNAPGEAPALEDAAPEQSVPSHLLSIEELSRLTGSKINEIVEVESFGLLDPKVIGGEKYYERLDLEIVQVVAIFKRYGIQPRHLRQYKTSAEREVGFMEQIIAPLMRQKSPSSRRKATEQLADLRTLGTCLRGYFMERMLQKYLDL